MSTNRFKELLTKRYLHTLSEVESREFFLLLDTLPEEEISQIVDDTIDVDMDTSFDKDRVFLKIEEQAYENKRKPIYKWIQYAAAILLILGMLAIFYRQYSSPKLNELVAQNAKTEENSIDISLPEESAFVASENGQTFIVNDSIQQITTSAYTVSRLDKGIYAFDIHKAPGEPETFHTFSTPKGVSNQLILSDGTKIWLNSSSEVQVSSHYNSTERNIRLVGEAYFDVVHMEDKPFHVLAQQTKIQVLGTQFNVHSLADYREVKTTLAKGSVQIDQKGNRILLHPGEQATTAIDRSSIYKSKADIDQVLAWKEGYFKFNEQTMEVIMKELLRWYDVEEIVWNKRTTDKFTLSFARSRNLWEMLKKIELISDVKFEIKERRVIVL